MAEPGHHAGHALHRTRLVRARRALPARRQVDIRRALACAVMSSRLSASSPLAQAIGMMKPIAYGTQCTCVSAVSYLGRIIPMASRRGVASGVQRRSSHVPHHAGRRWQSARAVGTHTAYAGSMGGLSPVPFGRWRDAWVDRRPRTLSTSREVVISRFRYGRFCRYPKWKPPTRGSLSSVQIHRTARDVVIE